MPCNRKTSSRPPRRRLPPPPRRRRGAFSLVELLVVIGIIAVLVGILIPVVGRMRREAFKVDTAALINTIRSATESYHANFKAYPGPFSDDDVYGHVKWNRANGVGIAKNIQHSGQNYVTGTEQLFLSLCGGLRLNSQDVEFNPNGGVLPTGPANLNPRNPKVMNAFLTDANKHLPRDWHTMSNFSDASGNVAKDTNVPEFIDRYPEPLPILYLRARRGARGVVTNDSKTPYQYDLRQVTGYTSMTALHGLQDIDDADKSASVTASMARRKGNNAGVYGSSAIPYLRARNDGTAIPKDAQDPFSPRSADAYILISAGPDRTYGTFDDITSFGPVE